MAHLRHRYQSALLDSTRVFHFRPQRGLRGFDTHDVKEAKVLLDEFVAESRRQSPVSTLADVR
jgi:hypothetical protein